MSSPREYCQKCRRPEKACFCSSLTAFDTKTRIVILMHPLESRRSHIGTGRLTHIALKNSEIIIDKEFDSNKRFNELMESPHYFPLLLYPGKESINIDTTNLHFSNIENKEFLIFVLDGTWPCAKSMMKKTTKLHSLPKISFNPKKLSQFLIKQQPGEFCLSTIESVYYLLKGLETQAIENILPEKEQLLTVLKETVLFHQNCARNPSLNNYSRTSKSMTPLTKRTPSKKWNTRKIEF